LCRYETKLPEYNFYILVADILFTIKHTACNPTFEKYFFDFGKLMRNDFSIPVSDGAPFT